VIVARRGTRHGHNSQARISEPRIFWPSRAAFKLPWLRFGAIILAAYVAAVLITYPAARLAGRVPVVEALRFE
jgi:hypothetical protein